MTAFVMPSQKVQLSFADPFTTADWADISPLAQEWSGKIRGRQHELDQFDPGQIALTLNNQDGRFSRWNTNSPYWNLLSGQDADCQNLSTLPNPQAYGPVKSAVSNGLSTAAISLPANSGGWAVLMSVIIKSGTITVSGISGPTGLTWASLATVTDSTDAVRVEIWGAYVNTNAAVSGNISVSYSGSVAAVSCELSYQPFIGFGSFTAWTFQTSGNVVNTGAGSNIFIFPLLDSLTPSVYFGAAWTQTNATQTAAFTNVNGFASTVTAGNNLVVYNPTLTGGTALEPAYTQTSNGHATTLGVMLSANGFTWAGTTNCTAAPVFLPSALWTGNPTNGQGNTGPYGLQMKATGSGTMAAATASGLHAYPVVASTSYLSMVSVAPASTTRNVSVTTTWYTSAGALISTSTSAAVAETASVWTKVTQTVTSPSNAAFAAVGASVVSAAANELHYVQRAGIFKSATQVLNTAWAPGQRSMVPTRSVWIQPTWSSTTSNTFQGYVDSFVPVYGAVRSKMTVSCTDKMALLAAANMDSSMYAQQVVLDGATGFWRCNDLGTPSALNDASGNNQWASVSGTVTGGQAGPSVTDPSDGACSFAAGGDATVAGFAPTGGTWTIETWFQMPPANSLGVIYDQGSASSHTGMRMQIASGQPVVGFFNAAGASLASQTFSTVVNDGNWHMLTLSLSGGTAWSATLDSTVETHSGTITSLSVSNAYATISGASVAFFEGNLSDISVYPTVLSATQIANHHGLVTAGSFGGFTGTVIESILSAGGWPSSTMTNIASGIGDIDPPTSGTLITTNQLSYIQSVQLAEQGAFYVDGSGGFVFRNRWYTSQNTLATTSQATLASDNNPAHFQFMVGSIIPASDNIDIFNDWIAQTSANGSLPQVVQDAASIARYGRRSGSGYTSLPYSLDLSALGEANVLSAAYAEPVPRIREISLDNIANAGANLPIMLGFDLLTRVTVIWQPFDGSNSPLQQDYLIESITHTVTQGHWKTTWGLAIPYTWLTWTQ